MTMILAAALVLASPAAADTETCPQASPPPQAEKLATDFMALLKAGQGADAVTKVVSASPLWNQRPGVKEQMSGQVDAGLRAYGPGIDYERICSQALGTSVYRQYYLARHRDMVTRWEFDLIRAGAGWQIAYFGFTDQVQTWF